MEMFWMESKDTSMIARSGSSLRAVECGLLHPRLPNRTQRISQHDSLPAQKWERQVVALRQGAAFIICRQQVVRPRATHQVGLVNIAGCPSGALVDQIGRHSLRRARPKVRPVLPRAEEPVVGRLLHGDRK